jgi:ribosomal protein S18 acetylase RimI-like enzyme
VRPYGGADDLRRMQAVTAAAWRSGKPRVSTHVGDIPWWLHQHTPDVADPKTVVLFERGDADVAWAVLWQPQTCFLGIHPDARQDEVLDAVLGWFEGAAGSPVDGGLDVPALESDRETIAALERRGYALRAGEPWMDHRVRSLVEPVEAPVVPPGYTLRHVRGEDDFARRVDVHRAAFAPSRVSVESYRTVRTLYPYRGDLDVVVEAPDGTFGAFAQVWLDEENGVGEFEPVGTHPDHQRRGLGRAVCLEGMRRLRALGADTAIVYSVSDSPAGQLYDAVGLRAIDRHLEYRLPAGA